MKFMPMPFCEALADEYVAPIVTKMQGHAKGSNSSALTAMAPVPPPF